MDAFEFCSRTRQRSGFHKPQAGYRVWESNRNVSLLAFENMEDKCAEGAGGRLSRKCELIYSSRRERPHRMGESGGERQFPQQR